MSGFPTPINPALIASGGTPPPIENIGQVAQAVSRVRALQQQSALAPIQQQQQQADLETTQLTNKARQQSMDQQKAFGQAIQDSGNDPDKLEENLSKTITDPALLIKGDQIVTQARQRQATMTAQQHIDEARVATEFATRIGGMQQATDPNIKAGMWRDIVQDATAKKLIPPGLVDPNTIPNDASLNGMKTYLDRTGKYSESQAKQKKEAADSAKIEQEALNQHLASLQKQVYAQDNIEDAQAILAKEDPKFAAYFPARMRPTVTPASAVQTPSTPPAVAAPIPNTPATGLAGRAPAAVAPVDTGEIPNDPGPSPTSVPLAAVTTPATTPVSSIAPAAPVAPVRTPMTPADRNAVLELGLTPEQIVQNRQRAQTEEDNINEAKLAQQVAKGNAPGATLTDRARGAIAENALKRLDESKRAGRAVTSITMPSGPGGTPNSLAQAIADYQQPFPLVRTTSPNAMAQADALMKQVKAANPDYDAKKYVTFQKTENDATTGKIATSSTALNTMMGHLDVLNQAADALKNGDIQVLNRIGNFYGVQTGKSPVTTYDTIVRRIGPEITKAYVTAGGSAAERGANEQDFASKLGPDQIKNNIAISAILADSKIKANQDQYNRGTYGKGKQQLITDEAKEIRQRLAQQSSGGSSYQKNHVYGGMEYLGGDPKVAANWRKVAK